MVKQLYYSELNLKNIEIYLSKLYIGSIMKFTGVLKYIQNTSCLLIVLTVGVLLIMSRVQTAVCMT